MKTILIADDNPKIAQILAQFIKKEGWRPVIAEDGPQTLKQMETEHPAAVLLDVMMPGMDGFEVCRKIRETSDVPVLMVTARGEDYDRIMGLDTGADDYIVKPFSGAEVMARIRAVLRRLGDDSGSRVKSSGCLTVNLDTYKASVSGQNIKLSKRKLNCCGHSCPAPAESIRGKFCWTFCGGLITAGTRAPWIHISNGCEPNLGLSNIRTGI